MAATALASHSEATDASLPPLGCYRPSLHHIGSASRRPQVGYATSLAGSKFGARGHFPLVEAPEIPKYSMYCLSTCSYNQTELACISSSCYHDLLRRVLLLTMAIFTCDRERSAVPTSITSESVDYSPAFSFTVDPCRERKSHNV
jgi:hypothetical protein